MAKRLVLFDIDGTLLHGGRLWGECFFASVTAHFPEVQIYKIAFGGKTDHQIYRELLVKGGLAPEQFEHKIPELKKTYIELAREAVKKRAHEVQVLPGVKTLLDRLRERTDAIVGLLTGNLQEGARAKLGAVGLWDYFRIGVFADDHWDRYKLPEIAVSRAREQLGREFSKKQIVIIGDTEHDVNCGKSIGVRTIAVGTGKPPHPEAALRQNPDYYFPDLSETDLVIEAIFEELES